MRDIKYEQLESSIKKARTIGACEECENKLLISVIDNRLSDETEKFDRFIKDAKPMYYKILDRGIIYPGNFVNKQIDEVYIIEYSEHELMVSIGLSCDVDSNIISKKMKEKEDITESDARLLNTHVDIKMYSIEQNKAMKIEIISLRDKTYGIEDLTRQFGTGEYNETIKKITNVFDNIYIGEEEFDYLLTTSTGAVGCRYTEIT